MHNQLEFADIVGSGRVSPNIRCMRSANVHADRGGYLAVSKRSVGIRIGAVGDTEDQARISFNKLVDQWFRAKSRVDTMCHTEITIRKKPNEIVFEAGIICDNLLCHSLPTKHLNLP